MQRIYFPSSKITTQLFTHPQNPLLSPPAPSPISCAITPTTSTLPSTSAPSLQSPPFSSSSHRTRRFIRTRIHCPILWPGLLIITHPLINPFTPPLFPNPTPNPPPFSIFFFLLPVDFGTFINQSSTRLSRITFLSHCHIFLFLRLSFPPLLSPCFRQSFNNGWNSLLLPFPESSKQSSHHPYRTVHNTKSLWTCDLARNQNTKTLPTTKHPRTSPPHIMTCLTI